MAALADIADRRSGLNDFTAQHCGKHVTVYCWSSTERDGPKWQQAEAMGRQLADAGFGVVTGGYCGSMEAVSKGAREAPQDVAVKGILVPGQFPDRALVGNPHLTESVDTNSLMSRLDVLTKLTRYYVALPGTLGTLTEIVCIMSLSVLHKKGAARPVILCFRDPWQRALEGMGDTLAIPAEHMAALRYVDTVEECVAIIAADYAAETSA